MNILVIPHNTSFDVKIRELELAKELAKFSKVYYLYWDLLPDKKIKTKIKFGIRNFLTRTKEEKREIITFIKPSIIHKPRKIGYIYNRFILSKLIKKYKIDLVINASIEQYSMPVGKCRYVYDLVDDHVPSIKNPKLKEFVTKHLAREINCAEKVIACSRQLVGLIKKDYHKDAHYIPNGCDNPNNDKVSKIEIRNIRKKYGLDDLYTIGCIGNHGPWSGLGFLINAYKEFKKKEKNTKLVIIGPGKEVDKLKDDINDEDIIFVGAVPPKEILKYFRAIDLGVLPFNKNSFTERALPLKIIEYTACKKIIISTPLIELKNLNFPNILFAEQNIENWVSALSTARRMKWNEKWNNYAMPYYWENIGKDLKKLLI